MIVGLTGGIGSGKTTVANYFSKCNNVAIYIADAEAKKLMHSSKIIQTKITALFGDLAYKDGILNRPYIGNIVFNDKEKLKALNAIVHPAVKKDFKQFVLKNSDKAFIVYESAILFESNSQQDFDFIITVHVDLKTRVERIIKRDHITKEQVFARINNQYKEDKKLLQSNYIIYNNLLEKTEFQVNYICKILTEKLH
ncbi:dephospho-CoA kinase [uncultured Polaribacter sp.]|uniref:dephospho-CoA kinase n=1 Tax=uncultured Polaribacter sp. TaxID=174711 RepID=UPI00260BE038|nr:dephospho-CoA kinase [uncultured Polaribacter sp.]